MVFSFYQWAAIIFCGLMIAKAWSQFFRKDKSIKELILWHIIFGGMLILAVWPRFVEKLAYYTGFESGINAVVFFCLAVLFYMVFRLVNIVENMEKKFTKLVRELALNKMVEEDKYD